MAERYLEQAVVTLASAFAENGDVVTSSIPDLSGTLTGLGMHIATLNNSLKLMIERQKVQEENSHEMRQRITSLEASCHDAHLRLEALTNNRDGIVAWAMLNPILEDMPRRTEVRILDERCNAIDQRVAQAVTKTEFQPFRANIQQQVDALEKSGHTANDKMGVFIKSTSRRLDDLKAVSDELIQSHATAQMANDNAHSRIKEDWASAAESLRSQLKLAEATASDDLGKSVEEIVKCLTKHSQAIDDINQRESRWQENSANVKEVHALRKEMVVMKRDMEASSYKVHEAYSKCLSIAALAGRGGGGGGLVSGAVSAVGGESVVGFGGRRSPSRLDVVGGLSKQKESMWVEQEARNRAFVSEATRGVAQTLETQIEVLRQDLGDLRTAQVPMLQSQLLQLRTVTEDVRRDASKTDVVMRNLMYVLAEGDPSLLGRLVDGLVPLGPSGKRPLDTSTITPNHSHAAPKKPLDDKHVPLGGPRDYDLAVTILDRFVRSAMDPVLKGLTTSLTQKQAFLQEEAVTAEVERRMLAVAHVKKAAPHGTASAVEEVATGPDPDQLLQSFRLGIEVADTFSAEQRFGATAGSRSGSDVRAAGVDVMGVERGGVGQRYGILAGDRILKVNGYAVDTAVEFISQLRRALGEQVAKGMLPATIHLAMEAKDTRRPKEVVVEVG